ncbi:hypothetical protein BGZ93_004137 [Podila epicladia]|nr:hypothetical protein BGZ93_004137 [Podila epicladia]
MGTQTAYHDITPRSSSSRSLLGEVCPLTHDTARIHRYEHSLQHHYSRYVHPHDPNDSDSTFKSSDDSGSDTSHDEIESRPHRQPHRHRKASSRGIVVSAEFRKHSEDTIREILARLEKRQHEMNSQRMYRLAYNNNAQDERVFHNSGTQGCLYMSLDGPCAV